MNRVRNLLLFLLLAVCAASFWWVRRDSATEAAAPATARPVVAASPEVSRHSVHVAVLNGTGEAGLARRFSRRMSEQGCVVVAMADAPHDTFSRSLLVNRRLDSDQAKQLARRLGGLPVVMEWDPRCREDAVVVLGHDHEQLRPETRR